MDSKAFKALLSWLYTLRLEVVLDDVHSVIMLARQCRHDDLVKELDDKWRHVTSFRKILIIFLRAWIELCHFYAF